MYLLMFLREDDVIMEELNIIFDKESPQEKILA